MYDVHECRYIPNYRLKFQQLFPMLNSAEPLQKPAITAMACPSIGGRCFALLQCSSPDEGVAFSWHVGAPVMTTNNYTVGQDAFLLTIINSTQANVQISCTARKDSDHVSHSITTDCRRKITTHTYFQ